MRQNDTLAKRIKRLMNEKEITQRQLAEELGVSEATVTSWTRHGVSPKKNIGRLAQYFDVDVDYILCKQQRRKKIKGVDTSVETFISLLSEIEYDVYPCLRSEETLTYRIYTPDEKFVNISAEEFNAIKADTLHYIGYILHQIGTD